MATRDEDFRLLLEQITLAIGRSGTLLREHKKQRKEQTRQHNDKIFSSKLAHFHFPIKSTSSVNSLSYI